ncbi:MAG: hypothetical protein AB1632_13960, partial [Nitrospirota bacterium]
MVTKRILVIIFSLILSFSLASLVGGFDNNANKINPKDDKDNRQRAYNRENASKPVNKDNLLEGGYFGGHDTITSEAALLKKDVHGNDQDFKNWIDEEALPSLRIGAHDEDSTKVMGIPLDDPPIGSTGWGGWFGHFYNPKTGKGLKGWGTPAPEKAEDYIKEIKKIASCTPSGFNNLSVDNKKKAYEYFGKSLHLLQDMAVPSHTQDDAHPLQKPFETYINNHWDEIVNALTFKDNVTADKYLNGNYKFTDISQYWKSLASISSTYPTEEKLLDEEIVKKTANNLIPEAIMHTAGYIDAIYDYITGTTGEKDRCVLEEHFLNPGGDHPDDRFDVSDEFYWEKEYGFSEADLADLYMRTAMKKGKIGVWHWKRFMELYAIAVTQYADASQEVKDAKEAEIKAMGKKLEERSDHAESDWKGAPDIALFSYGFYKPSISLLLRYKEPVAFMGFDFNPQIVKDHPVMVIPSGGLFGLENSTMLKAQLDEYVKQGGTLVVFAQQHGYEFNILPVPQETDGLYKQVMGYGWTEDQSCFANAVYIDTQHQMLSSISKNTPTLSVDGYFTNYPANTTVLLRRTANGQPAMIMYDHGLGKVIVSSMYSDFAMSHNQASQEELALVRDMI